MKKDRIIDLLREEQTPEAMAKIMGNYYNIPNDPISKLIDKIEVTDEIESKKNQKINKGETPTYEQVKHKLKDGTITKEEIENYRKYIDSQYNKISLKEVILMIDTYVETKRTSEAIKFLNSLIGNEDMKYLGKKKLIDARNETEKIQKIQEVRGLLKNDTMKTSEIAEIVGLNEIEVIKIKNQMQEDRERE